MPLAGQVETQEMKLAEVNNFDLFIGLVLARLYEARPKRLNLSPDMFGLEESGALDHKRAAGWGDSVEWLAREGYIRVGVAVDGTEEEPGFIDVELTEKGFRVLNSVPAGLRAPAQGRSVGTILIGLAKQAQSVGVTKLTEKSADEGMSRITELVQRLIS
jgi:hypothetical protein